MTLPNDERYEVIRGDGPDTSFVELWDKSLAPGGLAFELIRSEHGETALTGHGVQVPFKVFEMFLREARAYLTTR